MNKRKKFLIKATTIVLIITILLWVMPGRVKRYFPNYIFFSALTDCYPDVLPLSAHNIRYYNFDFFYIRKSGYKATLSKADYEKLKARQWNFYSSGLSDEHHLHDGVNKLYINREDLKQNKIDFIDELLPLEEDDGNYYFLAYDLCDVNNYFLYDGVICNDEKNESEQNRCAMACQGCGAVLDNQSF